MIGRRLEERLEREVIAYLRGWTTRWRFAVSLERGWRRLDCVIVPTNGPGFCLYPLLRLPQKGWRGLQCRLAGPFSPQCPTGIGLRVCR